jgi:hypothetical protein
MDSGQPHSRVYSFLINTFSTFTAIFFLLLSGCDFDGYPPKTRATPRFTSICNQQPPDDSAVAGNCVLGHLRRAPIPESSHLGPWAQGSFTGFPGSLPPPVQAEMAVLVLQVDRKRVGRGPRDPGLWRGSWGFRHFCP